MDYFKHSKYPLMEAPFIAFLLAIAAGSMDGYTFFAAKAFSTVQSGNIILLGQTLATNNIAKFTTVALTILCFGLGSIATGIIQLKFGKEHKSWTFAILSVEALILFAVGFSSINAAFGAAYVCMIISFIAGMQGNAFHKIDGMLYGNVAVTLVVQLAFNYIIQAIFGKKGAAKDSVIYFIVLLGFAIGGLMGTFLTIHIAEKSLWVTGGLILLIGIIAKVQKKEDSIEAIDPV
ncbi:YoaK family protein [Enterococcus sp. 5H]|uniref:YoaK family protein n=1 Tax=Enterococcus sp. 5H TaxID=1229490 RepID=UPI00230230AE|nr:YoaK family protein [Enterococcus sp. 5H]MDA9470453.1 hypothetical protein [Enterococcus sp. 5H]